MNRRFYRQSLAGLVVLIVLGLSVGSVSCATPAATKSDREAVASIVNAWKNAVLANDIDAIIAVYAADYSPNSEKREAVKAFYEKLIATGELAGASIATDRATFAIDGDAAIVSPITVSTPVSSTDLKLSLVRERGAWRVAGVEHL